MQEAYATIYDEAIAKGEARGIAKGEARGIAKGEARGIIKGERIGIIRGKIASLLRLLEARGLELGSTQRARITSCTEVETLDRWFDRAVRASCPDELFEG